MKFSREFYIRAFFFAHPHFFHFRARLIFAQRQKKLVFRWYLVREKKQLKLCLLRIEQFYFRALLVCADYILRENKTHTKIS